MSGDDDILLIIDAQDGFISNDETAKALGNIEALLQRGLFPTVIATRFRGDKDGPLEKILGWHGMKTPGEIALAGGIAAYCDMIVDKAGYSCVDARFTAMLKGLRGGELPDRVFVCGFDTEACVMSSVLDLFDLGIRPVLLVPCCASSAGPEYHEAALKCLETTIGEAQMRRLRIDSAEDLANA